MSKILLTGATGSTGAYLLEVLSQKHRLYALCRDPEKTRHLRYAKDRVTWIQGDLSTLCARELPIVDYCIHPATAWGGEDTFQINVTQPLQLFEKLSRRCKGIHYFSTASLLDQHHHLQPEAFQLGTDYIRSKAVMRHCLEQRATELPPLHMYYPTVVLGGSDHHPFTAVSQFLPHIRKYLPWIKWLRLNGAFHWIHALDIAHIIAYRIENQLPPGAWVLGNPSCAVADLLEELLRHYRIKHTPFKMDLEKVEPLLLSLFSQQMSPWDRFSFKHRHIKYRCLNTSDYNLPSAGLHLTDFL